MSMHGTSLDFLDRTLSSATVEVKGQALRMGGQAFDFQVNTAPSALVELRVSNDGHVWAVASDADGQALTSKGAGFFLVRERPEFAQAVIAVDAGGPQSFTARAEVAKDVG